MLPRVVGTVEGVLGSDPDVTLLPSSTRRWSPGRGPRLPLGTVNGIVFILKHRKTSTSVGNISKGDHTHTVPISMVVCPAQTHPPCNKNERISTVGRFCSSQVFGFTPRERGAQEKSVSLNCVYKNGQKKPQRQRWVFVPVRENRKARLRCLSMCLNVQATSSHRDKSLKREEGSINLTEV